MVCLILCHHGMSLYISVNGRVSVLKLENQTLGGTLGPSLGNLTFLRRLVLENVGLHGEIPAQVGRLKRLQDLIITYNKVEGEIPIELSNCTNLLVIRLFNNRLTGRVPSWFGSMQLSVLVLGYNNLVGTIPPSLGNISSLTGLSLASNHLVGNIPHALSKLSSLIFLSLALNNLSGEPHSLYNLSNIQIFVIMENKFFGSLPSNLNLVFPYLQKFSVGGNQIRGTFPSSISNITDLISQLKLHACLPSGKHERSLKKKLLVIISVSGGILISFIAFLAVHFLTGKLKKLPSSPSLQNERLRVTYGDLHEATNGISASNLVGVGSFGSVYRGSLLNIEGPIAVKVLNLETRGAAKSFIAECNALRKMKHRNLVKILTCCSSVDYKGEDFKAIVFVLMPNGSLENLLHDTEGSENHSLSLIKRVDIALDVAHALDYLHNDTENVVVHCDVKPSNVLLDDDFVAHLGDFGLARLIYGYSSKDQIISSTIKGTIGYVPPEYGAGGPVSPEGDIYSYGILLLEMLTGKRPTDNMFFENASLHQFCKTKNPERILEVVDQRLLKPFADDQTGTVENKIKKCLVIFAEIGVACSEEFPVH